MKVCKSCNQLYQEETYFFCLHDGSKLDPLAGHIPSEGTSVITVVAKKLENTSGTSAFAGDYLFEDIATDGLAVKVIPDDDGEWITFAFKITLQNRSRRKKDVYVSVKALDDEGFEVESYMLTAKLKPQETKTITDKNQMEISKFRSIIDWNLEDITGHDE